MNKDPDLQQCLLIFWMAKKKSKESASTLLVLHRITPCIKILVQSGEQQLLLQALSKKVYNIVVYVIDSNIALKRVFQCVLLHKTLL